MVNDVDYTRIFALALHDWSACARVGLDEFPPHLVTESAAAGDTRDTLFLPTLHPEPPTGTGAPPAPPSGRSFVSPACRSERPGARTDGCLRPLAQPESLMAATPGVSSMRNDARPHEPIHASCERAALAQKCDDPGALAMIMNRNLALAG
jgi:hypothetical protein